MKRDDMDPGILAERFFREVRILRICEGAPQIQQLAVARNMLKDAA